MNAGERQVAPSKEGIRRDHVARYEFVAARLPAKSRVIDFACGVGYGTRMLAANGWAYGYDCDEEALVYADRHYAAAGTFFVKADGNAPGELPEVDVAVCFETIEHLKDPRPLLRALHKSAPVLYASVPNEDVMPFEYAPGKTYAYHFRHYTAQQFAMLLEECGWVVTGWHGQHGPESDVAPGVNGRTLVAACRRADTAARDDEDLIDSAPPGVVSYRAEFAEAPKHIAIVGLGPSSAQYLDLCKRLGGRKKYCDETWSINALGDVLASDLIFHMDDVRIQQIRADAAPDSNIAGMLEWIKTHPGPIMTSRAHPDYPGLVEFPLEDVLNEFENAYFNSTAAYAVAYAIFIGATKISLFGCDFSYAKSHDAEKGRACVEFWLGMAAERGIKLAVPKNSTLLDACYTAPERFYGFDCVDLAITREGERIKVGFAEKTDLPTAQEIEERYDHSQPTVPEHLVSDIQ